LVLLVAALVIACAAELAGATGARRGAGAVPAVVREFSPRFSNEKFVVPICSAMGFAYVLSTPVASGTSYFLLGNRCARAHVARARVVIVGFLVNIPLVSQTSTAVCLARSLGH